MQNIEIKTVHAMFQMHCTHFHSHDKKLCPDCQTLAMYAEQRIKNCVFGNNKPTCKKCPVHCFNSKMREKIKSIMRWSGPKMIYKHPFLCLKHMIQSFRFSSF
ncbi:MAG TPA: nitrous oxide-stimulated promoter family protein [Bacteroidales bacterium]|nr:MAG: hypothetical protein A2X01_18865 [Bacteroidetes bacterium GWF2_35_48]OFZ04514.1 MAG: hypothetical protein A2491_19995 [Bacteroidetes bacterium RIFOXYC12_FULL_35_7]HBX49545.1 nitrous oxide-stimulated promoter family protein [Bacteroidales bacterium]